MPRNSSPSSRRGPKSRLSKCAPGERPDSVSLSLHGSRSKRVSRLAALLDGPDTSPQGANDEETELVLTDLDIRQSWRPPLRDRWFADLYGSFSVKWFFGLCRFLVWRCVQVRLACSAGDSPVGVEVRAAHPSGRPPGPAFGRPEVRLRGPPPCGHAGAATAPH